MDYTRPDITVIIPVLNEAAELPGLLASLVAQENVTLELIICDGGSSDGSQRVVSERAPEYRFPVRLIQTACGRGHQMNAGAAAARSELLLFLHADSRFDDSTALCKAAAVYQRQRSSGSQFFAGRFGLQFRRSEHSHDLAWFYYEAKARLPRIDCIRGDQGFLLNSRTFSQAGGFAESMRFLEDIRLVAATLSLVEWQLLPAAISTSARRFEKEGVLERQVLNAIIVNSVETGWTEFFDALPEIYRCHSDSGRLLLAPLLEGIARLITAHEHAWQRTFWRATGHHVAGNAWQLFFWLDARRAFRNGKGSGEVDSYYLDFYRRRLEPFFRGRLAAFLARGVVKLWLRWMLLIAYGFRGTSRTA